MAPRYVGCCGWAEAQRRYVHDFPVIEIQQTFYEPPAVQIASKWRTQAPDHFQFCIKAWQLITHTPASPTYRRLKSPISPNERELYGSFRPTEQVWLAWERTREIATILRAAVIVFQCPASFRPTPENVRNLRSFFERAQTGDFRLAWEPRGEWTDELLHDLCTELRLVHCVDPFDRSSVAGDVLYWRLHGRGGYSYRYTDSDLQELKARLDSPLPAYVLFNNMRMKEDALRFMGSLRDQL
jgi:uncharacterized protein YecE (DUF72 family)